MKEPNMFYCRIYYVYVRVSNSKMFMIAFPRQLLSVSKCTGVDIRDACIYIHGVMDRQINSNLQ